MHWTGSIHCSVSVNIGWNMSSTCKSLSSVTVGVSEASVTQQYQGLRPKEPLAQCVVAAGFRFLVGSLQSELQASYLLENYLPKLMAKTLSRLKSTISTLSGLCIQFEVKRSVCILGNMDIFTILINHKWKQFMGKLFSCSVEKVHTQPYSILSGRENKARPWFGNASQRTPLLSEDTLRAPQ